MYITLFVRTATHTTTVGHNPISLPVILFHHICLDWKSPLGSGVGFRCSKKSVVELTCLRIIVYGRLKNLRYIKLTNQYAGRIRKPVWQECSIRSGTKY